MRPTNRFGAGLLAALLLATGPTLAQTPPSRPAAASPATPAETIKRLPGDVVTKHVIDLPGRTLHFTATAGSVALLDAQGVTQAQVAFIDYTLDDAAPATRPVSFALNGGPGSASAWLQLGMLGPWRMAMEPEQAHPSAPAIPMDNADTWLDFTDLVFIDPVGTGFSKLLVNSEENRKKYWSLTGDVASLADAMRIWLVNARRMTSPKYLIGESYSGIRGPRLARELTTAQGVGLSGLVLISPKLDYGNRSRALGVVDWVAALPSMAAIARAKTGPVTRASMADVEAYAAGDYMSDLIRGEDPDAVARRIEHVATLTGLDRALVERRHGKVTTSEFLREIEPGGRVASIYDGTTTKADPFPQAANSNYPDPMTDALQAPFVSAMYDLYARKLNWLPEGRYEISSDQVHNAWDYGKEFVKPESMTHLRQALAADQQLHVLIAHGLFDVVTPYFDTQMMLNQIPKSVGAARVDFQVYAGGHMFYSHTAARIAFREAAKKIYGVP